MQNFFPDMQNPSLMEDISFKFSALQSRVCLDMWHILLKFEKYMISHSLFLAILERRGHNDLLGMWRIGKLQAYKQVVKSMSISSIKRT